MAETRLTDDFLNKMRVEADPLADDTVRHILTEHDPSRVNLLLRQLLSSHEVVAPVGDLSDESCKVIESYIQQSGQLPAWADPEQIKVAEKLFETYGVMGFSLLGCSSLPVLYTCGRGGTQVLTASGKLEWSVRRRTLETSQFVLDTMSRGGLDPAQGGKGIHAAQRVRLMHGAIRTLIQSDPCLGGHANGPGGAWLPDRRWPPDWGVPISQETMGCTILTFSYTILQGLRKFGVDRISKEQESAYLHAWSVVGHIMGIRDEFLTPIKSMENAQELYDRVMARNRSQTPEEMKPGRDLTFALIEFMAEMIRKEAPFWGRFDAVQHISKLIMMPLLGEANCALLDIELDAKDLIALLPFRTVQWLAARFLRESSEYYRHAEWLFRIMARYLHEQDRELKGGSFEIPDHLWDGWRLARAPHAATGRPVATQP